MTRAMEIRPEFVPAGADLADEAVANALLDEATLRPLAERLEAALLGG